jgi:hypothetical protein
MVSGSEAGARMSPEAGGLTSADAGPDRARAEDADGRHSRVRVPDEDADARHSRVRVPDGYGAPLLIAGIGGSGTRVAAQLLIELGFYLGDDLNPALDNLTSTFLFKRPRWYARAASRQRRLEAAARLFTRSMTVGTAPPPRERLTMYGAMLGTMPRGIDRLGRRRGMHWAPERARRLLSSAGHDPAGTTGWGWKEPNAMLLLEELEEAFPGLRFIHVLRDPEQIARGRNHTMLYNWSQHLGIEPPRLNRTRFDRWCLRLGLKTPRTRAELIERSLEFSRVVTGRTEHIGRTRLGGRYHQLDVNRLCDDPDVEIEPLLAFLELTPDAQTRERLRAIPDAKRLTRSR